MAYNPRSATFWQSLKRLPERTPLRVKLITALLALVAVALVVISVAGIGFLRNYLLSQQDTNLYAIARSDQPAHLVENSLLGQQQTSTQGAIDWIDSTAKVHVAVAPIANQSFTPNQSAIPGPQVSGDAGWVASGGPVTLGATSGGGRWRVVAYSATLPDASGRLVEGTIVVGINVSPIYQTLGKLAAIDWIVSSVLLLFLAVVGVAVIRTSLRPLTDIEQTAGAIAAGDLTRRVPERDPQTEVGRLGQSLNVMLSQIEAAFDARSQSEEAALRSEARMRQFVADASHELRTPLTAIRGFAEYYRQRGGVKSAADGTADAGTGTAANGTGKLASTDLDRIMRRVEQESARMGVLVEDMLLLARLDQQRPLDQSTVDLLTLAADAVHDARMVAPDRQINLTVGTGAALLVNGDEVRLRQVIGNLMSNALSHTPDGTPVDVRIRSGTLAEIQAATASPSPLGSDADPMTGPEALAQSAAVLEVSDHGPGLTQEQAAHAFERFYRADVARTTGGTGLGLAIVAALVAAHGGAVWIRTQEGAGATFAIGLPLAPEAVREPGQDDEPDEAPAAADSEASRGGHRERQDSDSDAGSNPPAHGSAA